MLYPVETLRRRRQDLNGRWSFRLDAEGIGDKEDWALGLENTLPMAVPSSYNDITSSEEMRDYIGDVWYETNVYVHDEWFEDQIFIRFGAVSHVATVYVNGKEVLTHKGGFLPFEEKINSYLHKSRLNRIVVRVNNELTWDMLPPGNVVRETASDGSVKKRLEQQHDFFNYGGIHRPVYLYTKPIQCIDSVKVDTDLSEENGVVDVITKVNQSTADVRVEVTIEDQNFARVTQTEGKEVSLLIENVNTWSPDSPYLYYLHIKLLSGEVLVDHYSMKIGVRRIEVRAGKLLLNGKQTYLKGFGKHEDSLIRGKGYDLVTTLRDFHLMKWTGANSFRTAHYPYAEEVLQLADEMGFLVIDETSAVGLLSQGVPATGDLAPVFSNGRISKQLYQHHQEVLENLIERDQNHPSVIMWSISNEASTMEPEAEEYFLPLIDLVRKLDKRPIMNVNLMLIEPERCVVSKHVDVIGLNVYHGWYSTPGDLSRGRTELEAYLKRWEKEFDLPIMIAEFGVDTIAGLHKLPPVMFSEEFQVEFLQTYQRIFDQIDLVCGEHVWNFADFMTKQDTVRVDGNKKGIFTRSREPKAAAFHLRKRWLEGVE